MPDGSQEGRTGRVLFVCTGNQCRSPMAEALLRSKLPPAGGVTVASAGTAGDGTPPPAGAVGAMSDLGLDIAGRASRPVDKSVLAGADVIVTMARDHLRAVAHVYPSALERSFTLVDLLRRAARAGGPSATESLRQWAGRMSDGRGPQEILTAAAGDDIADPMGGEFRDYERTAHLLDRLTSELAAALCGVSPPVNRPRPMERSGGIRSWIGGRRRGVDGSGGVAEGRGCPDDGTSQPG